MIGAQDLFTLFRRVAIGLRVVTAAASAVSAQVALFAILRQAIARESVAAAVQTCQCNHAREFTLSPVFEPLPIMYYSSFQLDAT